MADKRRFIPVLLICLLFVTGCGFFGVPDQITSQAESITPSLPLRPSKADLMPTEIDLPPAVDPNLPQPTQTSTSAPTSTSTVTQTPTATEVVFEVGSEITIEYLRDLEITGSEITFEEKLPDRANYHQHLVSYISEGNKIYGLLTIPFGEPPEGGFKAIVFNHGYIPPAAYRTTERYRAYVDYLALSGFVVFKIDYRGHGDSEGEPSGSYFSPGYTIDSIAALKSLQKLDIIDPNGIGMWGHSMAGNLVLRVMLVEPDVRAGVIWAGAVYSYDDFAEYGINDNTYEPPPTPETQETPDRRRRSREIFETFGRPDTSVPFWKAVSLTENIQFLTSPIQIHHAEDDRVVDIAYSTNLAAVLQENGKYYEFFTYEGGGHNLISPYFDQAMLRTVAFFRENL
jgi:dipeptidyl aminopeptidase/acylaminoacyl peptidase